MQVNSFFPSTSFQAKLRAYFVMLAVLVAGYLIAGSIDSLGGTMFVLVPFCPGVSIGISTYRHRESPYEYGLHWLWVFPLLLALTFVLLVLIGAEGVACGLVLFTFAVPFWGGGFVMGRLLARWLHKKVPLPSTGQALSAALLLICASSVLGQAMHRPSQDPVRTLTSSVRVEASAQELFQVLSKGRDFSGRAGLANEIYHMPKPGSVRRLDRDGKWEIHTPIAVVTAKVTQEVENRLLAFDYLSVKRLPAPRWPKPERFDKWLTLQSGSFEIAPVGDGQVRLTRSTTYRWHLRPPWAFAPLERLFGVGVHDYALRQIAEAATGRPAVIEDQAGRSLAFVSSPQGASE